VHLVSYQVELRIFYAKDGDDAAKQGTAGNADADIPNRRSWLMRGDGGCAGQWEIAPAA